MGDVASLGRWWLGAGEEEDKRTASVVSNCGLLASDVSDSSYGDPCRQSAPSSTIHHGTSHAIAAVPKEGAGGVKGRRDAGPHTRLGGFGVRKKKT